MKVGNLLTGVLLLIFSCLGQLVDSTSDPNIKPNNQQEVNIDCVLWNDSFEDHSVCWPDIAVDEKLPIQEFRFQPIAIPQTDHKITFIFSGESLGNVLIAVWYYDCDTDNSGTVCGYIWEFQDNGYQTNAYEILLIPVRGDIIQVGPGQQFKVEGLKAMRTYNDCKQKKRTINSFAFRSICFIVSKTGYFNA